MIFRLTDNFGARLNTPLFVGCVRNINPFVLDSGSNIVNTSIPTYRGAPRGDTKGYCVYFSKNDGHTIVVCPD